LFSLDVEQLIKSPILTHDKINVKFKRTKQILDQSAFLLKALINTGQNRITGSRIKLYVSLLIENNNLLSITDLSTLTEQVFLIQCNDDLGTDSCFFYFINFVYLDFNKVRQQYELRPRLQERDISLIQRYQSDAVVICYIDQNKLMKYEDLQIILQSVWKDIFTFHFPSENQAEVEFIHVNGKIFKRESLFLVIHSCISAFKEWMSAIDKIKEKFQITVTPLIDNVDENEHIDSPQSIPFNIGTLSDNRALPTKIILRSEWAMVAAHPVFQLEYQNYICNYR
jgi:hypothetical protein